MEVDGNATETILVAIQDLGTTSSIGSCVFKFTTRVKIEPPERATVGIESRVTASR
jgi:hypothetical protein